MPAPMAPVFFAMPAAFRAWAARSAWSPLGLALQIDL